MGFPASRTGWFFSFSFSLPIIARRHVQLFGLHRIQPGQPQFVGLSNYQKMFSDDYFLQALRNNVVMHCCSHTAHPDSCSVFASTLNRVVFGKSFSEFVFFFPIFHQWYLSPLSGN